MPNTAQDRDAAGHTSTTVPGSSCRALYRGDDVCGVTGSSSFRRTLRKRALQKGHRFSISAHRTMQGKQNLRTQHSGRLPPTSASCCTHSCQDVEQVHALACHCVAAKEAGQRGMGTDCRWNGGRGVTATLFASRGKSGVTFAYRCRQSISPTSARSSSWQIPQETIALPCAASTCISHPQLGPLQLDAVCMHTWFEPSHVVEISYRSRRTCHLTSCLPMCVRSSSSMILTGSHQGRIGPQALSLFISDAVRGTFAHDAPAQSVAVSSLE